MSVNVDSVRFNGGVTCRKIFELPNWLDFQTPSALASALSIEKLQSDIYYIILLFYFIIRAYLLSKLGELDNTRYATVALQMATKAG